MTRPAAAGLAVPVALIGMYEGPYTGFLANFTDSDTARMPSDYTASIRWSDDGTTSAGPSDLALCLGGGRFRVQASWQTAGAGGAGGSGHAMPLTDGTGTFWFFAPDNVELIVKVRDGCAANGHHWVFAAGLTDVAVTLTVNDTQTGETRTYTNQQGIAYLPVQDVNAFSTCP